MKRAQFAPRGVLALRPEAFGLWFDAPAPPETLDRDGVAVVSVRGALESHDHWCFDSYDSIRARVADALARSPKALVLAIDSPGGTVAGMVEAATAIRSQAAAAGVPVIAYIDGCAASAAYALACSASRIVAPATAIVGSIGTIAMLFDERAQLAARGISAAVVTSGARKADGNPVAGISEDSVRAAQQHVDELSEIFFELVASARGLEVSAVRALEAGVLVGEAAQAAGLVDDIATLDELLAELSGATPAARAAPTTGATMEEDQKAARKALQAIIDGDGDEKAKGRAKKALAAMDEEEAPPKAETPPPPPPEKTEEGDAKAIALSARAAVDELRVDVERRAILATRPDLEPHVVALLAKSPVADVKAFIEAHPRKPAVRPAAAASVTGTRGEGQGDQPGAPPSTSPYAAELDRAMGLGPVSTGIRREGNAVIFGVLSQADAARIAADKEKTR